ncbi:hypothetical protein SDC9_145201 [bioreactor metagenome]|uniref:Uncharacterized protein n=1 Tax=bioreactor metagenome TaxID=1076179 RepID=A0A645E8B7_9ZZZZ
MRQHQHRTVELGDHIGQSEGLAGAGHAKQGLKLLFPPESIQQGGDGLRLVAGGPVVGFQLEQTHDRHSP